MGNISSFIGKSSDGLMITNRTIGFCSVLFSSSDNYKIIRNNDKTTIMNFTGNLNNNFRYFKLPDTNLNNNDYYIFQYNLID